MLRFSASGTPNTGRQLVLTHKQLNRLATCVGIDDDPDGAAPGVVVGLYLRELDGHDVKPRPTTQGEWLHTAGRAPT